MLGSCLLSDNFENSNKIGYFMFLNGCLRSRVTCLNPAAVQTLKLKNR